jgi:hypothetical protein
MLLSRGHLLITLFYGLVFRNRLSRAGLMSFAAPRLRLECDYFTSSAACLYVPNFFATGFSVG